jgi:hypothetical protein
MVTLPSLSQGVIKNKLVDCTFFLPLMISREARRKGRVKHVPYIILPPEKNIYN